MKEPYATRRERFAGMMGKAAAVFAAPPITVRNSDVENEYRQDSDLIYLTGFEEPEAVLVLAPARPEGRVTLFVRGREPDKEIWTGRRAGPEGAIRDYGVDAAFPVSELKERLPALLENVPRLYYRLGRNRSFDDVVFAALDDIRRRARTGVAAPAEIVDPGEIAHELRLIKSPPEQAATRRAAEITCAAHLAAMQSCKPGQHEYEVQASVEYVFRKAGATGTSFLSIVAAGANTTVLHYTSNRTRIGPTDLVLVDAGCEWEHYAADVTRTFPASGAFTSIQRSLYEVVLEALEAALEEVRPGAAHDASHKRAVRVLTEGMVRLGLLKGEVDSLIEREAFKRYYPHNTSHWLGLDVHDVGRYKIEGQSRSLAPGMILTVEPGLYVQPDDMEAPEAFRGIGVRIEDNVLVTETGREILTNAVPKAPMEVEAVMRRGPSISI